MIPAGVHVYFSPPCAYLTQGAISLTRGLRSSRQRSARPLRAARRAVAPGPEPGNQCRGVNQAQGPAGGERVGGRRRIGREIDPLQERGGKGQWGDAEKESCVAGMRTIVYVFLL